MKIQLSKNLPQELTSYDLLKSFAVITMVVDHIGMYLFPEQNEWRLVGRMSMPVWLFLIGYAQTRELAPLLWIGGSILVVSNIVVGESIFSLNIFFTILAARLVVDSLALNFLKNKESALFTYVLLALLVIPTSVVFDYGTFAFLFAMLGYFVRDKENNISAQVKYGFMLLAVLTHAGFEALSFAFNQVEAILLVVGLVAVCYMLILFKPKTYPEFTVKCPHFIIAPLQLMGRHSLEIYVVHLLILKSIAFYLYPERFGWFQWHWLYG